MVDQRPYLIRGGEIENSSSSSLGYLDKLWPKFVKMHFNTILAPVYWELMEPRENQFDFKTVDGLLEGARRHKLRVVLLWFGSWKNSMSSYAPGWVKRDETRFCRAKRSDGSGMEILSALCAENLAADSRAFAALMRHLQAVDHDHTVVMVQVENEVGMIPEARDHSPAAEAAFHAPVPRALTDYLSAHRQTLDPALKTAWESHGAKAGADWEQSFGAGPWTDELFTAWTEGLYTGKVAAAGKQAYALPMFVNAALVRPGRLPGQYPSGGPLPHLFDIWRAAAPAIDFLSPDLYFPNFVEWAEKYRRDDNAFFMPETGRVSAAQMGANAFYAFGHLNAMGFSPYAPDQFSDEDTAMLGQAYEVLHQLDALIAASQGSKRLAGVVTPFDFSGVPDLNPQKIAMGGYVFDIRFKRPPPISTGAQEEVEIPGAHGGIILQLGPDEFLVAGTGLIVNFAVANDDKAIAGIEMITEGVYAKDQWIAGRVLNGDDSNQGRTLRLPTGQFEIRRVRLYHYR
jgi:beta-galactosidase GanA